MKSILKGARIPLIVATVWFALTTTSGVARAQAATVTIYWNNTFQTIDGFGTSQAGFAPNLYAWPEPQRTQILDLAFSQALGIGLTIFRTQIRPCLNPAPGVWDYSNNNCVYPPGSPSPATEGLPDASAAAQVWMVKEAAYRGPVKNFGTVWSPPAWMKTNGSIVGGSLSPSRYQDYATYLSRFVKEYANTNGIHFSAVSMANEVDGIHGWDSCIWTGLEIASFLANYLSPTFAANQITAKVIAPETIDWDQAERTFSELLIELRINNRYIMNYPAAS